MSLGLEVNGGQAVRFRKHVYIKCAGTQSICRATSEWEWRESKCNLSSSPFQDSTWLDSTRVEPLNISCDALRPDMSVAVELLKCSHSRRWLGIISCLVPQFVSWSNFLGLRRSSVCMCVCLSVHLKGRKGKEREKKRNVFSLSLSFF